jgi:hypothetical protein
MRESFERPRPSSSRLQVPSKYAEQTFLESGVTSHKHSLMRIIGAGHPLNHRHINSDRKVTTVLL